MDRIEIARRVRRVLNEDARTVLDYLFESVTKGESGPLSDIDVGICRIGGGAESSWHREFSLAGERKG